ncbi:DUF4347 domain-containing protein [Pseudomonas sp. BGr12]|uniref:DUF4347 domain-containing protein n=1 Tax=Pseudomonas sp. BGr12 TaxID=2936269 RepID=UPI00255969CE|nr:DUF4347 domain-containing protein [Pseudomonas sp. BJa5]MDL2429947.1 DUF4347 domain-containing protein [Pseudomonas sp. BJa5]
MRSPLALSLEARMMFDGAVAATVADTASSQAADHPAAQDKTPTDSSAHDTLAAAPTASSDQRHEVVFVDSKVANYQQLVASLKPGTEVVVLDGNKDGLQQIAQYLNGRTGIDAIHILSHGEEGEVHLGNTVLSADNLASKASQLSAIGDSLDADGDILLYGCDVAKGSGEVLLQQLSALTRADVAASTDRTGAAALGGNWTLEAHTGSIETQRPWASDSGPDYADLLALPSANQSLGDIYWTNNTGGNTVDGFTLSESTGAVRESSPDSIYFSTSSVADGDSNYYYQLTWTADNVDLGKFDLDGLVIQSFGGNYRLDVSAISGGATVTQSFTFSGAQGPLTVNIDSSLFNDISGFTLRVTQLNGSKSVGNMDLQQVLLTDLKGPNADPVLGGLNGKTASFTEDSGPTLIDAAGLATVSDSDSANFDGGQLRVAITSGQQSLEDVLGIRNQGTAAGQISVSGANISYGGVLIGTYTGGIGGSNLVVTFNSAATAAAAQALVRNLTYVNSNGLDPNTATRTISVTVSDGDGGTSAASNVTLSVIATNDAPMLAPANNVIGYTENAAAVALSPTLTLVDDGSSFQKATVTISDLRVGDSLTVGSPGAFATSYNSATGVLTITGAGNAAALQAVLRSVSFSSSSDDPTFGGSDTSRQINFVVTDSAGDDSNTAVVQVAITAINDAPTLSGGPYTWVGTNEDTSSQAVTVSSLLAGVTYADVDGPASGIALTASTGSSVWQYSTDGVTWTDVGAVSNGSALLLSGSTLLRYVPDGKNGGTATLTFRAWDQTFGIASLNGIRSTSDTSSNGGSTAFSTGIAQATISVSSVNDAPVLIPSSPMLNTLTDGDVNNVGQAVSSLITGQVSDVDTGAVQGIAITGLNSGVGGTWQFSLDSGASWQDVGTVSTASALLLRSSDRVRFVPDGVHGTTASFTFKAWDQSGITAGQQGFKLDASSSGGTTPFSLVSDTASVTVVEVNDAPTVTSSGGSAAFVEGADVASTPVVVDSGLTVSDNDSPLLYSASVKITGNLRPSEDVLGFTNDPATMGDISGSYNAATGTMTFTSASGASAAQWQAALRSVTYSNSSDTPDTTTRSVSFSVSDGQLDSADATRSVTVTAANDSPQLSLPGVISLSEDATGIITGIVVSDVDAGTGNVQVTFTLPANSGILFATVSGNIAVDTGLNTIALTGKVADINAYIAGMNLFYSPNANFNGNVTLGVSITDLGNSGGPAKTDSGSLILQVDAVNDAPSTPVVPLLPVSGSEDVPLVLNGISFSDIDAGSGVVQATFSVAPGSGTFSALAGAGVTLTGSGTNQLVLSGSLSDINAFIAGSQVSYLSAANASGIVIVTVSLDDRGNTGTGGAKVSSATFNLDISPVNDAPVNSVPGAQTVLSNETLVFSAGNGNAISISDVDVAGGNLRVTLVGINGLITLGSISGLSFLAGDGTVDAIMTFDGSLADINNALAGLSFTPMAGYHGAASLQIITNDQGQSGSGGQQTDTDIISINVEQPNPRIVGVSAGTPDGTYKVGDQILVLVEFDQSVSVDTTSGRPSLLLETGTIDRTAQYLSGGGSNILSFLYTVQAGDQSADLNIAGIGALSLNGARIFNARLDDAFSDLPDPASIDSLASRANLVIDGVAPVVNSVTVPANGTYVAGQNLDFVVNFSENVIVDTSGGTPNILVTLDGGGTVLAQYLSGSGSTALLFRLVVSSGQFDSNGISLGSTIQTGGGTLRDSAGNDINTALNSVASTTGVLVDAVVPTVSSVSVPAGAAYNAGDTLTFTVNTSETVLVNGVPRLLLDIGGSTVFANLVSGSGTSTLVFQYTVQAGDNDADGISVSGLSANGATLRDVAGNNMNLTLNNVGVTSGVIVDTVAPTPSAIVTLDPSPTNAGSVRYTVTFSEGVSGVDLNDFSLASSGTAAGSLSVLQQIDARTYQITVSGVSGTGTLGLNLNASGTGILDAAGNPLSGGLTGAVYSVDRDAPTVTAVNVPPGALHSVGDTLDFVVQTSEGVVVGGSPQLAIDMGGRTVYADYVSGSGSNSLVFRYTVQAGDNDADGIQISGLSANGGSLRDGTGNNMDLALHSVGSTSGIIIDTLAPTPDAIVTLDPSPTSAGSVRYTVTFSEGVSGVDLSDFSLVGTGTAAGSLSGLLQIDARTYQITVSGVSGTGTLGLDLNGSGTGILDAAGNALSGGLTGAVYSVDRDAPTPSAIVTLDPSPTNAGSVRYTVTFSEDVSGVDLSDFALVGTGTAAGTLSGLQQIDAHTYQITVSGVSGTGTLGLNLNSSATDIVDATGNALSGGLTGAVYSVDRDAPTVTAVSVPAGSLNNAGDTLDFVVQTSEAVVVDGAPKLAIDMGGRTVYADYVSGSGSNSLVFRYTVQAGDNDADGIQVSGLSANGGSLRDATGNALNPSLNGIGDSHGVLVDTRAPTATGVVRLDPSPTGASTVNFLVTFDEDVSGVDAGDFSLVTSNSASGSILSVVQVDARIYRVTVGSVSGQGSLGLAVNAGGISDAAGNALANSLRGDSYVIGSLSDGDPEFRVTTPGVPALPSPTPLQPDVPVVVTPQGTSPVLPPSLFPSEGTGGLPPLGNIFVHNGAPSQSFIAQAFGSSSFGDGSGKGFLGFGGGDAGVFGSSTLAGIFDSDGFDDSSPLKAFDRRSGDIDQGIRGIFGAPSLTQQLQQIHESEQQPLRELAWALGQVAQDRDAS